MAIHRTFPVASKWLYLLGALETFVELSKSQSQQIGVVQLCPQHVCELTEERFRAQGYLTLKETLLRAQVIRGDERDQALTSQVAALSSQSFCINQLNKSTGARTGGLVHLLTFISYRLESCFRQWHVASLRGDRHVGCKFLTRWKNFTFTCKHVLFTSYRHLQNG